MSNDIIKKIDKVLHRHMKNKHIYGIILNLENGDNNFSYQTAVGEFQKDQSYALASISKLYTLYVILSLQAEDKLQLSDTLDKYFSKEQLSGLHIMNQTDYSASITIGHLLSHTSGLPDYYTQKEEFGTSYAERIFKEDAGITFEQVLEIAKRLKPHFIPGTPKKAYYSDTNFMLLGEIIKQVSKQKLSDAYRTYIFDKLNLKNTDFYQHINPNKIIANYLNHKKLIVTQLLTSSGASGGIVSDSNENMIFFKQFIQNNAFEISEIIKKTNWNPIQWQPLLYGLGMMRIKMPETLGNLIGMPDIIGHSGSSGTFCFYCPKKDLYITGTINQIQKNPFPLIYQIIACYKNNK